MHNEAGIIDAYADTYQNDYQIKQEVSSQSKYKWNPLNSFGSADSTEGDIENVIP